MTGKEYPYVYVDGIYLRRNWGGEYENVAILVAIAVNQDGFREVIGAYSPFLSQHFLSRPEIQGKTCGKDAESNSCTRE